ncbi:hypothetical protein V1264_011572 [Littorina saxatilis]|uniref:Uncharacterized protein n=2 Tax=Littorina saxatilis TaxID=31220 RepID=A0AAN9BZ70_9CAEN
MSGSSSSIFCVQRNSSLVCTACTAITQGSNRPWSFHSSSQPSTKRWFSRSSTLMKRLAPEEVKKRVEGLTDRFAEARELLGDARESLGSTYFSEDMQEAQEAVSETLTTYEALLADLDEDQRNDVVRSIGLRMEELRAQEQAIKDLLD